MSSYIVDGFGMSSDIVDGFGMRGYYCQWQWDEQL